MTTKQAKLIGKMCQDAEETQVFHKTYKELLSTCSDAVSELATKTQVSVTVAPSQSQPAPPSTPKAMGPEWWNDRLNTQIKDLALENDDLIDANVDMVNALNHWGLEDRHASLVDNVCAVIERCAELKKELEIATKKRQAIIEAGNHVSTLLKNVAEVSIYSSHRILAKQYTTLWEDNTTPGAQPNTRSWTLSGTTAPTATPLSGTSSSFTRRAPRSA